MSVADRPSTPFAPPDERTLKALSHPLRYRILVELNEGGVASPNQLAQRLGKTVGVVAYHVRYLRDLGAVELVDTKPRRGATEHFYRANTRAWVTDEQTAQLPRGARSTIADPDVRRIVDDAAAAVDAGGFDEPTAHSSWLVLELGEEEHEEVVELLDRTLEELVTIRNRIRQETADGIEGPERRASQVAMLHFRPAPGGNGAGSAS